MEKLTGIWLDNHEALIVSLSDDKEHVTRIKSEVEDYHLAGGYGSSTPYGPQDAVSEKRSLNAVSIN